MQYLVLFDDGTIEQANSLEDFEHVAVQDGYVDIIRFHDGQYERWAPGQSAEWERV